MSNINRASNYVVKNLDFEIQLFDLGNRYRRKEALYLFQLELIDCIKSSRGRVDIRQCFAINILVPQKGFRKQQIVTDPEKLLK